MLAQEAQGLAEEEYGSSRVWPVPAWQFLQDEPPLYPQTHRRCLLASQALQVKHGQHG